MTMQEELEKIFDQFEVVGQNKLSLMIIKEYRDKIIQKILSAGYVKKDEIGLDEERIFELIKNIVSNRGKAQAIREHKKEIIK